MITASLNEKYPYRLDPGGFLAEHFPVQEHIQDELDARQWSYVTFAEKAGRPLEWAQTMMKGNESLSEEDAHLIEKALDIEAYLWLALDKEYRAWRSFIRKKTVNLEDRR
ncbi:hypothetical protein [Candidatus Liberibacter sp.]|uniref:hypothetical protein n=1 Tax=Candidatus Liberibacter sp. TaxID=34022 RepID=UPI0015F74887|nr:hypothetical protein [Candidatus Liberibacter sp.]MBA5724599.1 hypothetical protein [Candidatus Liberibacter sp.]